MDNLNDEMLEDIDSCASRVEGALLGLAALIREPEGLESLNLDEMNGISEIIMLIRNEVQRVNNMLIDQLSVYESEKFASQDDLKKMKEVEQKREKMNKEKEAQRKRRNKP